MTPDPANGDVIAFFVHAKLIPNNKGLPYIIILENGKAELMQLGRYSLQQALSVLVC